MLNFHVETQILESAKRRLLAAETGFQGDIICEPQNSDFVTSIGTILRDFCDSLNLGGDLLGAGAKTCAQVCEDLGVKTQQTDQMMAGGLTSGFGAGAGRQVVQ